MATIKNIIQTIFTSQGAGSTARDIETLGRAQTRLGQSSASAGRSFAAQAQGMGGLVAAYAGAAATTFALQQGFDKLAKSARAMQTIEGLSTLAGGIAQDGSAILKSVQDITKGQMTLVESASQINLALSAGFNTKQIEGLSSVALKASRALGRDLTDAMTRVTRGSAKMETELLDELGIYTKIEPATRAYAAALGKNVRSLTEFERRQAFVNSVIAEGERKFAAINTTIPTSAEKIEAFGARILDLGTQLGGVLADVVAPLAEFMTNNLTASFSAFALVVSMVASKAIQVFLGAIEMLRDRALASSRALENKARIMFGIADAAKAATSAVAGLNLTTFQGTQAEKNQIAALQDTAKARALTRDELVQSQKLIQKNIATLNTEREAYRQNIREAAIARGKLDQAKAMTRGARPGDFSDPAERARNAAIRAANREIAATRPAAIAAVQALPALRAQLTQLEAAYNATGAAATGARARIAAISGAAIAFAGKVVSNLAAGTGAILGLISKIFFFVSIIQLAGSAIANFLGYGDDFNAFFVAAGKTIQQYFGIEQSKKIKSVLTGITGGALASLEKTNSELAQLQSFKFKEKKILGIEFSVEKTKEDLVKDAADILSTVSTGVSDSVQDGLVKGALAGAALGAFGGPIAAAVGAAVGAGFGYFLDSSYNEIEEATNKYGDVIRKKFGSQLTDFSEEASNNAIQALSMLEERMGRQAMFDPQARAAKEFLETLILQSAQYSDQLDTISKIVTATGKQSDQIVAQFDFEPVKAELDYINSAVLNIKNTELRLSIANEDSEAISSFFDQYNYKLNELLNASSMLSLKEISPTLNNATVEDVQALTAAYLEAKRANSELTLAELPAIASKNNLSLSAQELARSIYGLSDSYFTIEATLIKIKDGNLDLRDSFLNVLKTTNEVNNTLLRSGSVLSDTFKGIDDGSLTIEKFTQNFTNAKSALMIASRELPAAQKALDDYSNEVARLDPNTEAAIKLKALIADEQARLDTARNNIVAQRELLAVLEDQESVLKKQLEAGDFFKSFDIDKLKNPLSLELDLNLAVKGDLTPLDELTTKLGYLQQFITKQSADIVKTFNDNKSALKDLALDESQVQAILSTAREDVDGLVSSLNKTAGVQAKVIGDTLEITTTIAGAAGEVDKQISASISLQEGAAGRTQQLFEDAVEAQKNIIISAIQELPKFIDKAINDYTKLIKDADSELKKLATAELSLKIKFDMDLKSLEDQISEIQSNQIVRKLQFEAEVISAKKDLNQIDPVSAAKQIEAIQQKIITEQQYQLSKQLIADQEALDAKIKLVDIEKQATQDQIKQEAQAQRTKILNDIAYVNGLTTLYSDFLAKQQQVNNKSVVDIITAGNSVGDSWARTFESGGKSVATAIVKALTEKSVVATAVQGGSAPVTGPESLDTTLQDSVESFNSSALDAMTSVNQLEAARLDAAETAAAREKELIEKNRELLIEKYQAEFGALEDSRTLQALNAEKAMQDANKGSEESAKKAEEARKKIVEAYRDIANGLRESIRTLAKEIVSFVGGILVSLAQSRVDNLKAQEAQLQDALAVSTSQLNDVSSRLEQTLSQETSQREELLNITKELTQSNNDYIKSLGSQDRNIQENSDTYLQNLLKQKRAILDLASSTRKAVALSNTEKKLSTINSSLQEDLNDTTFARMDAEERLVATQGMLQTVTDAVTASSEGLVQGLTNLRSAMLAMMEVTGMVSGSEMSTIAQQANMSDAFGALSGAVNNFKEGVTSLKKVNGNYVTASGKTVANVEKFNATMNTVSNTIGGAVSGFNIGSSIATALGVSGFATQIGGAIGGIITSGAMGAAITSAITSGLGMAVGSMGATLISFAVPIIGPILGALVGSLFAKKPKAGASAGFDASGDFVQTGSYASGGGSNKGFSDIMRSTYTSFFGSLEEFGIELQKQGKNFGFAIDVAKKRMTASFTKNGQKIMSQQVSGGEDAAKFFIDAFLKTFDKGDLIVKATVAYADNLQAAIDNFATKTRDDRTQKIFSEYLQFATKFATKIAELRGPATSTADAIDLIKESAKANTAQLTQFYISFLDKTKEVFGESSKQYDVAGAAVRKNALAQIGLADSTDRNTGGFIALSDAMESVNTGTVMIENAIANINAFAETLRAIGQFSESEVSNAIAKSREITITSIVTNMNDSLQAGIDLLTNPAVEAVATIENVTANAANRVSSLQGVYNALIANSATEAQKKIAATNIALSNQLSKLELTSVLNNLSEAELKAVVAAESKIDATTREEAATRLAAISATKFAKAQVKIADIGRRIASELSDLPALPNIVTSVADLMELFTTDTVTPFVKDFSELVNNIAKGKDISANFSSSLSSLTDEFTAGNITADQYTEGLDLVATTTLDVISTLEDMISKYEDLAKQVYSAYQAQVDAVSTAAENVGAQLTEMLDSFGSATTELLKIYDTTLASVAKSGNELFDLKDAATSAFETAAKAVKEFEDANKLSGKSSSAVLADITSIQQQLNELSSKPFDLASLMQFSKLSSQQRALQSEYNKLTTVEKEYNDLLSARTSAQEDLAFATATIDSLSSTLIDTRRTESEIVQKVQDAAIAYSKSQENLNDITKLLTESNFNLNQIRSDETNVVAKTITLLDQLRSSFVGLGDVTSQILSTESNLQEQLISAARENYRIRLELATEAEKATMAPMEVFLNGVRSYYEQLKSAAVGIQGMLENPINSLSESLKKGVLDITAFNLQISDQFSGFSEEISKYIDLATVSNNIKDFANSLDITQNRFAILASSSGPLSGLNQYLQETYNTIGLLTESGNYLDLSFERVKTAFGSIFTALGTDTAGLVAAVANISIVGEDAVSNLSNVTSYLKDFTTQIGAVKVQLTNIDAQNIPVLLQSLDIDVSPLKKISELVQVVNLVDTDVGTIDLTNLNSFAGSVVNIVSGINSTLNGLNLNLSSNISTDITNFIYGLGDVLDIAISLDLKEQVQTTVRTYVYSVGDTVTNLQVSGNLANSAVAAIETYVSSTGSSTLNTVVNATLKDSAKLSISNYVKSVGDSTLNVSISSNLRDSAILAIKNYAESIGTATSTISISSNLADKAAQAITNYVNSIGDSKTTISISGTTLRDNAILAVKNYVSAIGTNTSTFNITGTTLSGNAVAAIDTYVKGVGTNNSTFNITGTTLSGNAVAAIKTYVEAVGTNKSTFTITGTTLSGNAVAAIDTYVKGVGTNTSTFSITGATLSGNAVAAIKTYVEAIGTNKSTFTITDTTLSGNAVAAIKTYVTGVGTNTSTFSITGTKLSDNAVAAIKTYVEAVGTNTSTFTVTGTTLSGNAIAAIKTYVSGVGTNNTTFTVTGTTLSDNAVSAISTYVKAVGSNTATFTVSGTTLSGNAVAAIKTYVEAVGTNTSTFTVSGTTLSGNAVAAIKTYVEAVGTNKSTFTVTGTTLSGNAVAAIDTYVKAVGTNTSTFSITGTTLSGNAIAAIKTYVEAVGTNKTTFTVTGTTLSDNAVAAIKTYVSGVGSNNSTFTVTGTTLSGNAVAAIKTYVEAVGTNTSTFTITGTTLSGNAVAAIKTYVEAVGTNKSTFTITGTTLSGNAVAAIDTYVKGVGTNTSTFTITGTTLSDNAVAAIKTYVSGVGTNTNTFTVAGTTLSGNAVLAIKTYVEAVGTNASTFTITGTTLRDNAVGAVKKYVESVGTENSSISLTYSTTAGLGANIKKWADNVVAGTDIAVAYSITTAGSLAKNLSDFIAKVVKGDSIGTTYDVAATGTLPNKLSSFIKDIVSGTGISTTFDTTVSTSTAGKLAAFIKSVVDGTNITMTYNTGTANTLANKIFGFTDNIFKGTGIDLTYNKSTTGTLAYSIDQYITSFKNAVTTAMSAIQDAFKNVTPVVEALRLALTGAAADGKDITTTQGLIEAIRDVNSGTGVTALTSSFKTLRESLTPLLDTVSGTKTLDGPLTEFKKKLDSIKTTIQTQWNNLQISATGTSATNPGFVRIVTTGTGKDPNTDALNTIAANSAKYPRIVGANYTVSNFAEGGHVRGPGTETSDSIPANLSNGEFVLKASAVRNIGVDTLNDLNSGKSISDIVAAFGRYGDTMIAHINPAEAEMLAKAGGSGTINPSTGLMEFFNKDGGAVARLFAQQEKDLLAKTYLGYFPVSNFNSQYSKSDDSFGRPERIRYTAFGNAATQPWGPNLSLEETYYGENGSWGNPGSTGLFNDYNRAQLKSAQVGAISLANEIIQGRSGKSITDSTFQYAQDWSGPRWGSEGVNVSGIPSGNVQTGWGPFRRWQWQGLKSGTKTFDARDGGWIAKSGQALTQFLQDGLGATVARPTTQVDRAQIDAAVDAANVQYGNSANLYMLGNTNESRPSAAMLTTGGLVQDDYKMNSSRDSVNALLEPGEFVLRKQAVDRMGLDNAIRLNSTGDVGGDIEVEVNINNNGTSQTAVGTPEVRRENGKIVVDIILEDLRNNGPINRQIRSIR